MHKMAWPPRPFGKRGLPRQNHVRQQQDAAHCGLSVQRGGRVPQAGSTTLT